MEEIDSRAIWGDWIFVPFIFLMTSESTFLSIRPNLILRAAYD